MKYMAAGSLDNYLRSTVLPAPIAQEWILDIANAICYAHWQHIIVGNVTLRNVLLDERLKAKLCDFECSGLVPLSTSMAFAEDDGAPIQTDIFQFGVLVYEMVSRERYQYDLFDNEKVDRQMPSYEGLYEPRPERPSADMLPATEHLRFGSVVRTCWTKVYAEMAEVCEDLGREVTAREE
jgi:serine/threonine protein kinase